MMTALGKMPEGHGSWIAWQACPPTCRAEALGEAEALAKAGLLALLVAP